MQALLASGYEGKIDLIYIDPPFWTGEDYYATFQIGEAEITKTPSVIERLAYKDIWEGGTDSFLDMLYPRLQLMRRLLAEDGSIYVHLDQHMVHYVKVVMDEVFGQDHFQAEIIWKRISAHSGEVHTFGRVHDTILFYSKSTKFKFNPHYTPYEDSYVKQRYRFKDPDGRLWAPSDLMAAGIRHGETGKPWHGIDPTATGNHWKYTIKKLDEMYEQGKIYFTKKGAGNPTYKRYLDEMKGILLQDIWDGIYPVNPQAKERVRFQTQKPEALLERIIKTSSNENDMVLDCFSGSGTTTVVAERLNRRWIACDFSKVAIQLTRNRLVQDDTKPFLIENIGNYQRQLIYLAGSRINDIQSIILRLYGAIPRKDYQDLGTRKVEDQMELVYVSYPDRPVTARKAEELEALAEHLDGRGYQRVVILGWDYEYNYDEILRERERASKRKWYSTIVSKSIPPEVYEYLKKAKSTDDLSPLEGKIRFHHKPYLKILKPILKKASGGNWEAMIGIDRYVVFDFPVETDKQKSEIQKILRDKPLSLIDYWAVDWNYDGMTFKSGWQAMRSMENKIATVPKTVSKELEAKRLYTVAVRVVDVFGNDAAGTVNIDLRGMS